MSDKREEKPKIEVTPIEDLMTLIRMYGDLRVAAHVHGQLYTPSAQDFENAAALSLDQIRIRIKWMGVTM